MKKRSSIAIRKKLLNYKERLVTTNYCSAIRNKSLNYKVIGYNIGVNGPETFGTGLGYCSYRESSFVHRDDIFIITGDRLLLKMNS